MPLEPLVALPTDLKGENILLAASSQVKGGATAKVGDFGLAVALDPQVGENGIVGRGWGEGSGRNMRLPQQATGCLLACRSLSVVLCPQLSCLRDPWA